MFTINPSGQSNPQSGSYRSSPVTSSTDWIKNGETAFANGNLEEAKRCFEKGLTCAPFDAKLHNNLSVVHWQLGETEEALYSLTRALELDPADQDVIMNCSKVFQSLGRKDDAREVLEAYLVRRPWDYEARRELENIERAPEEVQRTTQSGSLDPANFLNDQGELQFEQGKFDHARACFEMAIEHDPNHAKAYSNLGVICRQQGNLQEALEYLYRALDIDSEDTDILYNCSMALMDAGELDSAANILKIYLQRNPQDDAAWEEYGALLSRMGAPVWSPNGLTSEVADVYTQMGQKLADLKDYSGAAEAYRRALLLDPERKEIFYRLGRLHLELGQKVEALEIMREGLSPGEFHNKIALSMGEILVSLGHREDARTLYGDYLADEEDEDVRDALDKLS